MAEYKQQLEYTSLPDGTIAATLLLTFPNGAKRSFTERLTPDDAAAAAAEWARDEGAPEVAGVLAGVNGIEVGAADDDPARWWWRNREAKRFGKRVDDEKALHAWWSGLAVNSRATYRATYLEGPKTTPAAVEAWWGALGKKRRELARERHGKSGGALKAVVKAVKSVDRAIDKSVLGKVAQVALPTFAVGRWSFKNPEAAAAFIPGGSSAASAIKTGVKLLPAAKKLAAGKVMAAASKSLDATGTTAVGAGAAKALGVAAQLSAADAASMLGAAKAARKQVAAAKRKLAGVSPETARDVYALATRTARAVGKLATGVTGAKPKLAVVPAAVLSAARAGRIKSNKPGAVSRTELAKAMTAGRVFFVRAAA